MLKAGADPGVHNTAHMTALHEAVQYNRKDVIRLLIDAGAPLEMKGGKFKRTPLHFAVDLNEMALVEAFLDKRASLMVRDQRGHCPIHIAAIRGNTDILRALYLADPDQDKLRISYYGKKTVFQGLSLFHIALLKKNEELLDVLIQLHADPNVTDIYGQTPLICAIMRKKKRFIIKLLNYERTDKRKPQMQGFTALHAAIFKDLDDIATILAIDSDVNAKDINGKTALDFAYKKANVRLIETLLANGAEPNVITKRCDTVLSRNKQLICLVFVLIIYYFVLNYGLNV
jgi:hypothetical protein